MHPKRLLSSKIAAVFLVILLALLVNLKFQQWQEERSIEKLKTDLQKQAAGELQKNQELSNSINYLNSDNFKERVARQQLGLKKDGEIVFNFAGTQSSTSTVVLNSQAQLTNPQKWWNYFFN